MIKVICSNCGKKFYLSEDDGFDPETCPSCDWLIEKVGITPTGEEKTAWVREE